MIPFALLQQVARTEGWWLVYSRNLVHSGWRAPTGQELRTQADLQAYWASNPPGNPKLEPLLIEHFKVAAGQLLVVMSAKGRLLGKLKFCFASRDVNDASLVSVEPNPVYRYILACKLAADL